MQLSLAFDGCLAEPHLTFLSISFYFLLVAYVLLYFLFFFCHPCADHCHTLPFRSLSSTQSTLLTNPPYWFGGCPCHKFWLRSCVFEWYFRRTHSQVSRLPTEVDILLLFLTSAFLKNSTLTCLCFCRHRVASAALAPGRVLQSSRPVPRRPQRRSERPFFYFPPRFTGYHVFHSLFSFLFLVIPSTILIDGFHLQDFRHSPVTLSWNSAEQYAPINSLADASVYFLV